MSYDVLGYLLLGRLCNSANPGWDHWSKCAHCAAAYDSWFPSRRVFAGNAALTDWVAIPTGQSAAGCLSSHPLLGPEQGRLDPREPMCCSAWQWATEEYCQQRSAGCIFRGFHYHPLLFCVQYCWNAADIGVEISVVSSYCQCVFDEIICVESLLTKEILQSKSIISIYLVWYLICTMQKKMKIQHAKNQYKFAIFYDSYTFFSSHWHEPVA